MSFTIKKWLLPASFLYGTGVVLRNYLFDNRIILKTHFLKGPIICVGNLTVGGTGKTPHTEYLIRLLQKYRRVAVVSRGYKRKTKGLVVATQKMTAEDIGDEPWQMMHKFENLQVLVCNKRIDAINALLNQPKDKVPEIILLDDAYQHRYVQAGLSILLTNYNRLMSDDALLPAGLLREPVCEKHRANIIIVTKCPEDIRPIDYRIVKKKLKLYPHQKLFFTKQKYMDLIKVGGNETLPLNGLKEFSSILLLTGIATPKILEEDLKKINTNIITLSFHDHHKFSTEDQKLINEKYAETTQQGGIIVTTEKDAARLLLCKDLSKKVKSALYALPIEIEFLLQGTAPFNRIVNTYVRENKEYK